MMSNTQRLGSDQNLNKGPLPIIVGVTGHRDLRAEDIKALTRTTRGILADLQHRHPSTPLVLLSPLAQGADRLVAQVALDLKIDMIVPLPMPQDEYERDFQEAGSLQEFRNLLARAKGQIVMPWIDRNAAGTLCRDPENRNKQYAAVGAFVAYYSQIVLALWDGTQTNLTGGTAQIVGYRQKGVPDDYLRYLHLPSGVPVTGTVVHIWTPRQKNHQTEKPPFTVEIKSPGGVDPKAGHVYLKQLSHHLDRFNRDVLRQNRKFPESPAQSKKYLFPLGTPLPSGSTPEIDTLTDCYARADALAIQFQKRYRRDIILMIALIVIGVVFLHLYAAYEQWTLLISYTGILGLATVIFIRAKYLEMWENRYLDYRALAEALRVQVYWRIAGIKENVISHYMAKHRSELDWILTALRARTLMEVGGVPSTLPTPFNLREALPIVRTGWIEDQQRYFQKTHHHKKRQQRILTGLSVVFFALALMVTVFAIYKDLSPNAGMEHVPNGIQMVFAAANLALAGGIEGYQRMLALREETRQYEVMADIFTHGLETIETGLTDPDPGPVQQSLVRLGCEALQENGDWVLIHRDRMELPKG
jgi:hypothetical protein